jgi:hypothetical protein
MAAKLKIVGINFDHMHMGDFLRTAKGNPDFELVGVSNEKPARIAPVLEQIGLPQSLFVADYRQLLERTKPDLAIICPSTGEGKELVVQQSCGRGEFARLSRVRDDAGDVVHEWEGAGGSDQHGRPERGAGGGSAQHHDRAVRHRQQRAEQI